MTVAELAERAGLSALNECGREKVIEGGYISDMVSDIITGAKAGSLLVTLQSQKSVIAAANLADVAAVVFARGRRPAEDVIALANKAGIGLFVTEVDTWTFALRLYELGLR